MKRLLSVFFVVSVVSMVAGCSSTQSASPRASSGATPVRSEREYAELAEARAQELLRTGRANSLDEARTAAQASINTEWAAAARRQQRAEEQAKFEKQLQEATSAAR